MASQSRPGDAGVWVASLAVPTDFARGRRPPGEDHDLVPGRGERAVEDRSDLPGSPGYHDFHRPAPSIEFLTIFEARSCWEYMSPPVSVLHVLTGV